MYRGVPAPSVTWSFGGSRLIHGVNRSTLTNLPFARILLLEISSVSISDAGQYDCRGTNNVTRLGVQISTSSLVLTVEGEKKCGGLSDLQFNN